MSLLLKALKGVFARRARIAEGDDVGRLLTKAQALSDAQQTEEARAVFREVLGDDPENRSALLGLGVLEAREQRYGEARELLDELVSLHPDCIDGWNALANVARLGGRWQDACQCYEKALALDADSVTVLTNLGTCLRDMGQVAAARQYVARALEKAPDNPDVLLNFATVLIDAGEAQRAESSIRHVLELAPDLAEAHATLSHLLLVRGEFEEGWREYDWRHAVERQRDYPYPQWQGEPVDRDIVLVRAEQGLGDQIMFMSCLRDLQARTAGIVLECEPRIAPMFARSFPGVDVHPKRDDNPERWRASGITPDKQVFMGSLPRHFRRRWEDFPEGAAYLTADPARVARWRARLHDLGSGPKVGVSWQGGTEKTRQALRSIPLPQWRSLFALPGVHWISLQYGPAGAQARDFARDNSVTLHHWRDAIDDYEETAALVTALDLVISVQTAAVHLAGALGRPAWVMVPHVPEWRYLANGERLPWYASVTVLRQRRPGEWNDVLAAARVRVSSLGRAGRAD